MTPTRAFLLGLLLCASHAALGAWLMRRDPPARRLTLAVVSVVMVVWVEIWAVGVMQPVWFVIGH